MEQSTRRPYLLGSSVEFLKADFNTALFTEGEHSREFSSSHLELELTLFLQVFLIIMWKTHGNLFAFDVFVKGESCKVQEGRIYLVHRLDS